MNEAFVVVVDVLCLTRKNNDSVCAQVVVIISLDGKTVFEVAAALTELVTLSVIVEI